MRHIAQEHSFAPKMWQIISNPDILIFLDVSYEVTLQRRKWNWKPEDYAEQQRRLANARENADLVINTDDHKPDEIAEMIVRFIE